MTLWYPAQNAQIAAGASHTFQFRGLNGEGLGVLRFITDALDAGGVDRAALCTITLRNGPERTILNETNLEAFAQIFDSWSLEHPIAVQAGDVLYVTVRNTHNATVTVNVVLDALTGSDLIARMAGGYSQPIFTTVQDGLGANVSMRRVDLPSRSIPVRNVRASAAATAANALITGLTSSNQQVWDNVPARMLHKLTKPRLFTPALDVMPRDTVTVYLTNTTANTITASILLVGYAN